MRALVEFLVRLFEGHAHHVYGRVLPPERRL